MVYTIQDDTDTTTLPNIQSDGANPSSGLAPIALPETDASGALLIPTTGPVNRLIVSGMATGSLATLQTFIAKMNKWVADGGKLSKANVTYVTTLNGTFSVRVLSGNWNWIKGNPNALVYNLAMIEGTFT